MKTISSQEAAEMIRHGKIGVMPTDTVFGLVASALNEEAVGRLYTTKQRENKPGTLIAASIEQLLSLGISAGDIDKVAQYWPNPLSAVLPIKGRDYLDQGVGSLAMRVVADPATRALLEQTGPLMTSSANQPGLAPATSIDEAEDYFGNTIDFYVDGGVIDDSLPSTIIRPTASGVEVLRQGSITL